MKYLELVKEIERIIPGAYFDTDNEGQIVIYTNLTEPVRDAELVDFDPDQGLEMAFEFPEDPELIAETDAMADGDAGALDRWAKQYDDLNGAPENDADR